MKKITKLFALALSLSLVACAPSNGKAAEKKMDKAGYTVALVESEDKEATIKATLTGSKGGLLSTDKFTATLYSTKKDAKEAADAANKLLSGSAEVVGKWVFVGSEDALKAFK